MGRIYLRVPIGGHSGPRGLEPELIQNGWRWKFEAVTKAVRKYRPAGVIIDRPWGDRPGVFRLDAHAGLVHDLGADCPVADHTTLAECLEDLWQVIAESSPTPGRCLLGVYMGGSLDWPTANLQDVLNALTGSLGFLPRCCTPIIDDLGTAKFDYSRLVINQLASMGFAGTGYEPAPESSQAIPPAQACYLSGWWFATQLAAPNRYPLRQIPQEVIVQAEQPFGTPGHVARALAAGCSVALDWYAADQYPQIAPAPDQAA